MSDNEWRDDALCQQVGGDLWFPEKGESTREAKVTCSRCPVIAECLAYALANEERFGVWGGKSERQRREILRKRGPKPVGYSGELIAAVKRLRAAGLPNQEVGRQVGESAWTITRILRVERERQAAA